MSEFSGFPRDTFAYLEELAGNNNRDWFNKYKDRYERSFLMPALQFVQAMQKPLAKAAPLLRAEPKKMGGSLMRIYRDTRFSKEKTPYKTNIGIQFRHQIGKDVHSPGVYMHIAADECFLGAGIWRAPSDVLRILRTNISESPQAWTKAKNARAFRATYEIYDDRLKTAPRGFDKDDPLLSDIRLRSFIGISQLTRSQIHSRDLVKEVTQRIKNARPLMEFLCESLGQPY